jgi:hypothetical protein
MSRFFKFLIMAAAIANLVLLFVFDGRIPENLPMPFFMQSAESEENEAEEPAFEEAVPEEADLNAQAEEAPEPETETEEETEELPEEVIAAEETAEEENPEEQALPECRIISLDGSNIRSGPGMDYEIVASYPYDMVLSLTGEYEIGWYSILAEDGTEGYIFETQIELPEGYVAEEAAY